jgi:hypothetical protein
MTVLSPSIFRKYYEDTAFIDRYSGSVDHAVDVIVPVIHTNELWRTNLMSFYREIPINRLLIGDGGCIDNSLEIAKEFPRVQILDHRSYKSLGYSIRKLIEAVETDFFVYLHSDVFLPTGWFDTMQQYRDKYDWFECRQRMTVLIEYDLDDYANRALSGSQMGRRRAFDEILGKIDDDFLYRNEDIILANLMSTNEKAYGRVEETFHYHQVMYKQSTWTRKVKSINFALEVDRQEEVRAAMMQVKGLVKYLAPDPRYVSGIVSNVRLLQELGEMDWDEFMQWVKQTNAAWIPLLSKKKNHINVWRQLVQAVKHEIKKMFS